jgi:hypothetical protein
MAKNVILDELHITIRIPNKLPDTQTEEVRPTLLSEEFMNSLRRAIRTAIRGYTELAVISVSMSH